VVKARLGIDPATLGFALLAMAVGAVISMPLSGWAVARFGSRPTTAALLVAFVGLVPFPILSGSTAFLFGALFVFGAAMSGLDVAVNTQASEVETLRGRPTMSFFHGFYSVGGLAGAVIGAAAIAAGWGNGEGAIAIALALLAAAAVAAGHLLPSGRPIHAGRRFALPSRAVVGLGLIASLCFAIEGAVHDWSTLFLASAKQAGTAEAAIGFTLYSLAMAGCRLSGDAVVARLGGRVTVVLGGGLIALGMAIAILSPWAIVGAIGFMLVGVGAANIVPVVFSAAARTPGAPASVSVAAVTTLGYSGFLVAPPLIGMVANAFGLSLGLWLVALGGLITAAVAAGRRWTS
jgi:MFS family permease